MVADSMLGDGDRNTGDLLTVLGVLIHCLNKGGARPDFVTSVCLKSCSKSHGKGTWCFKEKTPTRNTH